MEGEEEAYVDWKPLGPTLYVSLETLYPLNNNKGLRWGEQHSSKPIVLEYMKLFCCGHGGLVAMVRDETKIVLQLGVPETERAIRVCTLSGFLVEELELKNFDGSMHAHVFDVGWTGDDCLVVVDELGHAHAYRNVGSGHAQCSVFSLGTACKREGLGEMIIASSGIYFRTKENRFWCIRDLTTPSPIPLADIGEEAGVIHCFDVIPSIDGALEVVVAINSELFTLDERQSIRFAIGVGPFVKLAVSQNGLMIAAVNASGFVFVFQNESVLLQVSISDTIPFLVENQSIESGVPSGTPSYLEWCGADAIVAYWQDLHHMLVIAMDGTYEWIEVGEIHGISSEVDGVCLLSQDRVQLCRIVPEAAASVLEPGSVSPGAILHDSRKLLGNEDVRASVEILDIIENNTIEEAVDSCLYSAGFTLDSHTQQSLIKAGCFGMAFSPLASKDSKMIVGRGNRVIDLARSLRILNALRDPSIGMPLTLVQYGYLGLARVIHRLCSLGHFYIALKICESVNHSPEVVLLEWSKRKISSCVVGCTDEDLFAALRGNLDSYHAIPWSVIADHALTCGRSQLASKLIELDVSIKKQIPLLLQTGKLQAAMQQALAEGDPDTIFHVLHSTGMRPEKLVDLATKQNRSIPAIWLSYVGRQNVDQLADIVASLSNSHVSTMHHAREAHRDLIGPSPRWSDDKRHYELCENTSRDGKLLSNACQAAQHLENLQRELEAKSGRDGFVGLSVADTIRQCFTFGMQSESRKLAKEYKMADRQYSLIHLDAVSKTRDWVAVTHLFVSNLDRKSAIDLDDVIDTAMKYDAPMNTIQGWMDEHASQASKTWGLK